MATTGDTGIGAQHGEKTAPADHALRPCAYVGTSGASCRFKALPHSQYCFWHDPNAPKTNPLVGTLLARLAGEEINMEGFQLAGIDLECRRLVGVQLIEANLEGARLFRAHLEGAHLFGANLRGASLFKSNLQGANLRGADLTGANLLGANVRGAKLEGLVVGKKNIVVNESEGNALARRGDRPNALKAWQEATEIYLALLNNHREAGRNEEAGELFYRLMVAKRKLMPRSRVSRWVSLFMDALCGYGERPKRVVLAWVLLIFVSSVFYFGLGILDSVADAPPVGASLSADPQANQIDQGYAYVGFDPRSGAVDNLRTYGRCLYFSVITMTTTGYGDLIPTEDTRAVAALEAFAGAFMMAVLVLVFGRKMMR